MEKAIKDLSYYVFLPFSAIGLLVIGLNYQFTDLAKAVSAMGVIIQSAGIFVGGLWAYRKFDWEKKAESAIKLKAMLMGYEEEHCNAAAQYRVDQANKIDSMVAWMNYALKMISSRNSFVSQVHLSCYIPPKTRQRLFDVVWLSVNKGRPPNLENIDENWKKFGAELEKVKKELDDIVGS